MFSPCTSNLFLESIESQVCKRFCPFKDPPALARTSKHGEGDGNSLRSDNMLVDIGDTRPQTKVQVYKLVKHIMM